MSLKFGKTIRILSLRQNDLVLIKSVYNKVFKSVFLSDWNLKAKFLAWSYGLYS